MKLGGGGIYLQIAGYKLPSNQGNQISAADPEESENIGKFHLSIDIWVPLSCYQFWSEWPLIE